MGEPLSNSQGPMHIGELLEEYFGDPDAVRSLAPDPLYRERIHDIFTNRSRETNPSLDAAGRIITGWFRSIVLAEDQHAERLEQLIELDIGFERLPNALRGERTAVLFIADLCERWGLSNARDALLEALIHQQQNDRQ